MKESYNRDPLVAAAEDMMLTEDVAKIQKKVDQLEVGDKTNFGAVVAIGSDSITFKAKDTPKTKIAFRQRKMGSPEYLLMKLVKLTPDGKKLDKTFKESNEFVGAAAAAKLAGEEEFEFEGEKFPVTIGLAIAKKIMGEDNEVLESNEFVGAAAAAKLAGEDEFEFEGEKFPVTIGLAIAKKIMGESFSIKEGVGSLQNSLKVLTKAGIKGRLADIKKLVKAVHKNYKAITGEKYQDADQVAMSEPIADLIGHFRLDGEDFIATWDKTIKEETEISETKRMKYDKVIKKLHDGEWESSDDVKQENHLNNTGKKKVVFVEATEFVKGDRVMDVRTKLKGTVLHKGNKDEVYVNLGAIKKAISAKDLRLVEATELEESNKDKYMWSDINNALMASGLNPRVIMNVLSKLKGKALKEETEELDESEHSEWFTCEIHVKSSGQLYSTFYVQAKDMGQAKKKADKVFIELMKNTYPKDWPSYSKKFTIKVMKGDNIGDLMP